MPSTETQDPYSVLGVPRTATEAEIRAAYRALVAQYHPDRHQGNPANGLGCLLGGGRDWNETCWRRHGPILDAVSLARRLQPSG